MRIGPLFRPLFRSTASVRSAEWPAEGLLLACCLWWVLACNLRFFQGALEGREAWAASTWGFAVALAGGLVALHALLLGPWLWRHATKPLLAAVALAAAVSAHYIQHLAVYLDPSMLRNVLRTDVAEARELLSLSLAWHLLIFAGPPLWLIWRVRLARSRWKRALVLRAVFLLAMAVALVGCTLAIFAPLSSLMRNQKELRYLINPAAPLWSTAHALRDEGQERRLPLRTLGEDAAPGPAMAARQAGRAKPLLVVFVVGETARAANWGLSGYGRPTTPELARLAASDPGLVSFPRVGSCGTNTEVSLPCMFAPVGRRDYDETRIRGSQSLLHVVARAGVGVHWFDNQSGCKGVCEGLPQQNLRERLPAGLCDAERCLDEALLLPLQQSLQALASTNAPGGAGAPGSTPARTQLLVLHMLGSHGPAYYRRYPPAFARFQPDCRSDDLRRCSNEEITAAYDNTLLYTDHVLARAIATLRQAADRVDSVLLFVSDHGESLGEKGLYLHGLPYAIAPEVQKQVPMLIWVPGTGPTAAAGAASAASAVASAPGLDAQCLRRRAAQAEPPVSHDHLFHTLLGLLDVRTALHEPAWDLTAACRGGAAGGSGGAGGVTR